ncbi:hypothetical protein FB451DRAFT_1194461 [Mycena latifolia]|nr:hypothetical protein FB451DRAFT_1194461 [Mycena latifolia]
MLNHQEFMMVKKNRKSGLVEVKGFAPSLKCKALPEQDHLEEQPHQKGTASGSCPRPVQASNPNATASTSTSTGAPNSVMPCPLTCPRPPAATPDVIARLHQRLTALESARSQDAERITTLLESKGASSSPSLAASAADLLSAQAQPSLTPRSVRVGRRARRGELDDGVCSLLPHSAARGVTLAARPSQARPPVRSPMRLGSASFRASHGASFARVPPAPRDISPLASLLLHTPKASTVLSAAPNTSHSPVFPFQFRLRLRNEIAPWRVH